MGLAATQTRFLSLTARKSNVEYQGQQINQQRTVLSNKSANMYSEMLTLAVPVPPSTADFTSVQYQFSIGDKTYQTSSITFGTDGANAVYTAERINSTISETITSGNNASVSLDVYGRVTAINDGTETYPVTKIIEVTDNKAYEDAYNQYLYKQYLYEQEIESINAKTAIIQQEDKALELQLNQLDTEQNEIKTEIEALDKIIGDNVESSYKTFGG